MTIENTFNLLFPRERFRITRSREILGMNKHFDYFIVFNAILAAYAYDSALFTVWGYLVVRHVQHFG